MSFFDHYALRARINPMKVVFEEKRWKKALKEHAEQKPAQARHAKGRISYEVVVVVFTED